MEEQEEECVNENSQLGKLIVRANKLLDRPVIDHSLSEILDQLYQNIMQSFSQSHINPISRFSFPEAALLLQACANVYSKRVDLLWITINECQKRMVSFESEENKIERQRLDEREQKYKRKRRKIVEIPENADKSVKKNAETFGVDWDEIANFHSANFEKNPKLFSDWCKKMDVNRDLQPVDRAHRSRPEKYCHFRSAQDEITDKDQDDELVVHTSKMESVIALDELFSNEKEISDDFSFELLVESQLKQRFLTQRQLRYDDFEKCSGEFEKFVSSYKDFCDANRRVKSSTSDSQQQKLRRISVASTVVSKLNQSDANRIFCQTCQVNVPRLSIDQLSRLSRLSIDEIFKCSGMCSNYMGNFQDSKLSVDGQTCQVHVTRLTVDNLSELSGLSVDEIKKISEDNNVHVEPDILEVDQENKALDDVNSVDQNMIQTTDDVEMLPELYDVPSVDVPPLDVPPLDVPPLDVPHLVVPPLDAPPLDVPSLDVPNCVQNPPDDTEVENNNNEMIVENVDSNETREVVKTSRQKRVCDKLKDDHEKLPRKARKLSKAALKKLSTGITADLRDFNIFYSAHYQTEDGEGEVEVPEFQPGDPLLNSSFIEDDADDDIPLSQLTTTALSTQDSGICSQGINTEDGATCSQGMSTQDVICSQDAGICMEDGDDAGPDIDATVGISPGDRTIDSGILTDVPDSGFQSPTTGIEDGISTKDAEETPLYQKVHEWKRYMHSIFQNKKNDVFDIHEYGANIMENLEMGEPKKFADVVNGKSAGEVARFFMSTLQLANMMNIEIQGAQSGQLSNDTFALNLLTKERYYDRLNDYMAPSEEYQENRKKIKKRQHSGEHSGFKRYKN